MERNGWEIVNGHKGGVMWLTGLSGSGKQLCVDKLKKNCSNGESDALSLTETN